MEEKTERYRAIIIEILNSLAEWWNNAPGDTKYKVIVDKDTGHLLMVSSGWYNDRFDYSVSFHFEIRDGKIRILQNNTDESLSKEFWKQGIPIKDIIIAWHSDFVRNMEGYEYGTA